jgi:hypothetical protein
MQSQRKISCLSTKVNAFLEELQATPSRLKEVVNLIKTLFLPAKNQDFNLKDSIIN